MEKPFIISLFNITEVSIFISCLLQCGLYEVRSPWFFQYLQVLDLPHKVGDILIRWRYCATKLKTVTLGLIVIKREQSGAPLPAWAYGINGPQSDPALQAYFYKVTFIVYILLKIKKSY